MKSALFFLISTFAGIYVLAQGGATTGKTSPIMIGAGNKVNYITKVETRNKIPPNLAPYVAGLIFANKTIRSDTVSNLDKAIQVWMNKYMELQNKVLTTTDSSKKNLALNYLAQGDFASVERTLKISTDFRDLKKMFPATYQTTGNQSPIIVGDYGTVTYIVQQIITYDLPEGLTVNLINELKLSQDTLKLKTQQVAQLRQSMGSKELRIREYINKYRIVEKQLQESPNLVSKRVLTLFQKQDFDGALRELDKAKGSDIAIASNELIKARILFLQLNFKAFDSTLTEINKAYNISVTLAPTYTTLLEYGKFLDDYYYINTPLGVPVLSQALDSATTLRQKVDVAKYLSDCYMASDIVKAMQTMQQALDLLHAHEPVTDSALLVDKATLQFYLGRAYSFQTSFDILNYQKALNLTLAATETLNHLPQLTPDLKFLQALFDKAMGSYYFVLKDTVKSIEAFNRAIRFFESPENASLAYFNGYVRANLGLADVYSRCFQLDKANAILFKTISMIENNVNLKSKVYVQEIEQTYTGLVVNLLKLDKTEEALKYSNEFRDLIAPFYNKSSQGYYSLALAEVDVDLGFYYLQKGDYPKSRERLQSTYNYYINNLSSAVADKAKFVNCIYYFNEYYATTNQVDSGISFNKGLSQIIEENKGNNLIVFTDLESQVNYQISELYFNTLRLDSAEKYVRQAISLSEAKAKQGPVENIKYYTFQTNGLCRILIRKHQPKTVDSLTDALITSCVTMSNFTPFIHEHYRGTIGFLLAVYGSFITADMDSLKINEPVIAKNYLGCQDRIFTEAAKHFEVANNEPNFDNSWNYAAFLYEWAKEQYHWEQFCGKSDIPIYHHKKNELLTQANTALANLPPTPRLDTFRQQIVELSGKTPYLAGN